MNPFAIHNFDPYIFQLASGAGLRWYGLAYVASLAFCFFYWRRLAAKRAIELSKSQVVDFTLLNFLAAMAGGKLIFALFYSPRLLVTFSASPPYWGMLDFSQTGNAAFGFLLANLLLCWWYARKHGFSFLRILDFTALAGSLCVVFIRLGNFVNGELIGTVSQTAWARKFPEEMYFWLGYAPEWEKLRALGNPVSRWLDPAVWARWVDVLQANPSLTQDPNSEPMRFLKRGISLLIEAIQRKNPHITEAIAPLLEPRHPAQLYQALGEGLFVFLALQWLWRRKPAPGKIAAAFTLLYALTRFIVEFWKMPNPWMGYSALGLTAAQWMCLVMLPFGLALWFQRFPASSRFFQR